MGYCREVLSPCRGGVGLWKTLFLGSYLGEGRLAPFELGDNDCLDLRRYGEPVLEGGDWDCLSFRLCGDRLWPALDASGDLLLYILSVPASRDHDRDRARARRRRLGDFDLEQELKLLRSPRFFVLRWRLPLLLFRSFPPRCL